MNFEELNLAPAIMQAVRELGYDTPTPIQAQAIPAVLAGQDLLAGAQTGTGKTAAFTLPMLHRLSTGERAKNNVVIHHRGIDRAFAHGRCHLQLKDQNGDEVEVRWQWP